MDEEHIVVKGYGFLIPLFKKKILTFYVRTTLRKVRRRKLLKLESIENT